MSITLKIVIILSLLLMDYVLFIPGYNHRKFDHTGKKEKLIFKGISIFILLLILITGIVGKIMDGEISTPDILWLIGMTLCAVGDIVLEIRFTKGGVLFGLGHIVYISALICETEAVNAIIVSTYIVLAIMGTVLTIKYLGKKHRGLMILYNLIICLSFALGINMAVVKADTVSAVLSGLGACFLVISDWILARNRIIGTNETRSMMCLTLYFSGQALIAVAMCM